jgi:hypothetical protein
MQSEPHSQEAETISVLQREKADLSSTLSSLQREYSTMASTLSRLQTEYSNLQSHAANLVLFCDILSLVLLNCLLFNVFVGYYFGFIF